MESLERGLWTIGIPGVTVRFETAGDSRVAIEFVVVNSATIVTIKTKYLRPNHRVERDPDRNVPSIQL